MGIALGAALRGTGLNREQIRYLSLPGKLFLRALHMLVLPVIVSSIVCGFAGLKGASKGKLLTKTMAFYLTSSMLAALTGKWIPLLHKNNSKRFQIKPTNRECVKDLFEH